MKKNPKTPGLNAAKIVVLVLLIAGLVYLGFSVFSVISSRSANPDRSRSALELLYKNDRAFADDHPAASGRMNEAEDKYGALEDWKITQFGCSGLTNNPCSFQVETKRKGSSYLESGTLSGSELESLEISKKQ